MVLTYMWLGVRDIISQFRDINSQLRDITHPMTKTSWYSSASVELSMDYNNRALIPATLCGSIGDYCCTSIYLRESYKSYAKTIVNHTLRGLVLSIYSYQEVYIYHLQSTKR